MRQTNFVFAAVAVLLIYLPSSALADEKKERPYTIHPLVGNVIDAQENEQYNLFGPIEGFIAAKVYYCINTETDKREHFLHLLGVTEKGEF